MTSDMDNVPLLMPTRDDAANEMVSLRQVQFPTASYGLAVNSMHSPTDNVTGLRMWVNCWTPM